MTRGFRLFDCVAFRCPPHTHTLTLHVVAQVPVLSLYKLLVRNFVVLYHYTHNPMKLRYRRLAAMTAIGSEALTL